MGQPASLGYLRDISDRKQIEEKLRRSEEKYRTILENIQEGYFELDLAGNYTFVNDAECRNIGYPREELIGMNNRQFQDETVAQKMYQLFRRLYRTDEPVKALNVEVIRKNGTKGINEISASLIRDAEGKPIGFRGISRDITERKQTEEELYRSQQMLQLVLDNIPQRVFWKDRNCVYQGCNKPFLQDAGLNSLEEIIGKDDFQLSWQKTASLYRADDKKVMKNNLTKVDYEEPQDKLDGSQMWVRTSKTPLHDPTGHVIGILGTYEDITEQKQAAEIMRESEERFRLAFENANTGMCLVDLKGNLTRVNNKMCEIFGYTKKKLERMTVNDIACPEDIDKSLEFIQKSLQEKIGSDTFEKRYFHKKGHIVICDVSSSLIRNADGFPLYFISQIHDITKRKQAQDALKESEKKYREQHEELETIIESSPIMIYFKDTENRFTRVNKALVEITGLSKEEIEGKSNEDIKPRQAAKFWEEDKEIIATDKPKIGIVETIKTRRGLKILQTDKVPHKDKEGNIIGIVGFSVDITEQKKAQEELLRSEEKYRSLVENAQEGIYQSTVEGRHLTINPAFARMLGYDSPEEVMATITDITKQLYVNPDDRKKLLELVNEKGLVTDFETEFYKKDGSRIWVSVNMHVVRNEQGRILYYQGINQDITEKKKIEVERQENSERLRKSLDATINAMAVTVETRDPYTAGHQRRVADLARAIATEMNLKSEQVDGVHMACMIHDIGKISIPSEILTKPTQLTNLEFNLIKPHSQSGYDILKDIEFPWPVANVILQHHERMDGSGYPQGLKGNDILLEARIIAVADVVESMASHRPYRPSLGIEAALKEIEKNEGILYDNTVAEACLKLFREKSYQLL
jgi:PAS domain S-box-containing protein